jgi:hypothetical protein
MTLNQPQNGEWYFNSGATSHVNSDVGTLSFPYAPWYPLPSSIIVGNGSLLPVTATSIAHLSESLRLNNVLISPQLIKNLISVRQFTTDNNCSIEFDPSDCLVKALPSQKVIIWCNSSDPLYPLHLPTHSFIAAAGPSLWHRRLGHPGHEAMSKLASFLPSCAKEISPSICHALQLGRHVRLPFHVSSS